MMCMSINSVVSPIVPRPCLTLPGHLSVKRIMYLSMLPIVPKAYVVTANARACACDTYTHTIGTIGIGIKWLFYL